MFALFCQHVCYLWICTLAFEWVTEWVSECFASRCGALRRTAHHLELVPKFGRERIGGKSAPSKTPSLLFVSPALALFARTIVRQRRWKWFHAFSLAQSEMDVRFYPAPPANVGSCSLPTDPSCLSSLDYYHTNKVNNYLCSLVHWNDVSPVCLHVHAIKMRVLEAFYTEAPTCSERTWVRVHWF